MILALLAKATTEPDDELVITSEIVTREQTDALKRLLSLPVDEGARFDFDYSEPERGASTEPEDTSVDDVSIGWNASMGFDHPNAPDASVPTTEEES